MSAFESLRPDSPEPKVCNESSSDRPAGEIAAPKGKLLARWMKLGPVARWLIACVMIAGISFPFCFLAVVMATLRDCSRHPDSRAMFAGQSSWSICLTVLHNSFSIWCLFLAVLAAWLLIRAALHGTRRFLTGFIGHRSQ